jgi:endonuclease/exonuclease/phosphatase (EEP) superfamily protein YafD
VQPLSLPLIVPTGSTGDSERTDVHALLERLEKVRDPLIVMGDFMTDQQDLYPLLLNRLCDSHRESGWGMGFTQAPLHNIGLAMLRIDYVFHSPDLISLSTKIGGYGGSDHRPVVSRLAWRRSH